MAKYQLKEPIVDILKITSESTVYTLEDGSTQTVPSSAPTGLNFILQSSTVISDADVAAEYIPVPLA